jgi:hypothetical protein
VLTASGVAWILDVLAANADEHINSLFLCDQPTPSFLVSTFYHRSCYLSWCVQRWRFYHGGFYSLGGTSFMVFHCGHEKSWIFS